MVSKIIKKHIALSFYAFLNNNNLLHRRQSGFRYNHSCQTALTLMKEEWLEAMNNGELTGVLMVDLCEAFDLVDHSLLLQKLEIYRCTTNALNWFTSYLFNRSKKVDIDGILSDPLENKSGVPQGSVLGTLFFILFINDIFLYPALENMSLFADDATDHHTSKNIQNISSKLQIKATSVNQWCEINRIKMSIEKTKIMLIGSRQKLNRISESEKYIKLLIDNTPIEQISNTKLLGIHIDSSLTWDVQVSHLKKIVIYKLFLLKRIRHFLPKHTRILFYNFYIMPYLEYCCSIWGNCSKENINIIVKLQKRAARLILDADFFTPSANLFKELIWIPFSNIVKYHQVSLVYKCIHKISPEYLHDMFSIKLDSKRYNLRSSNTGRLDVPKKTQQEFIFQWP